MSSPTGDDLVGLSFSASIGEPWDFESDAGPNRLQGTVQMIAFDQRGNPLLLCEVVPFSFSSKRIHQVIAVNRYCGSQDVIDALRTMGEATLNFCFLKSGDVLPDIGIETMLSDPSKSDFLVGRMYLSSKHRGQVL
ncbi:MAG: hypothetical protein ACREBU_17970 [Nitrososphaera sp.]